MNYTLRITYSKKHKLIKLKALNKGRFNHYGFGTFLEDIKPGEISIAPDALEILLHTTEHPGLQGMELWPNKMLAWGSPSDTLSVPIDQISVNEDAPQKKVRAWLKKCFRSKK